MIGYTKKILLGLAVVLAFIMTGCSGANKVESSLAENVAVDGDQTEWGGYLQYYEDDLVSVGFKNDNENLYMCLVTQDQSLKKSIMRSGLIVWFEPKEGDKMGLKFPVREKMGGPQQGGQGGEMQGPPPGGMGMSQNQSGQQGQQPGQEDAQKRLKEFFERQTKFSIINEDEYPLYQLESDSNNIEVKAKLNNYNLVYEIKMPLYTNNSADYFLTASPGEQVKIAIQTPEEESQGGPGGGMSGGPGGGMGGGPGGGGMGAPPSGGMGGGPGGMGGGMSGGPGGMMDQSEDSGLDMKFKVTLVPAS